MKYNAHGSRGPNRGRHGQQRVRDESVAWCDPPPAAQDPRAGAATAGPVTARLTTPAGFKVVRVDMATGDTADFAVNKVQGPGSKLPHRGFERPSHCQFGPDGALYVVDFGQISIAPEKGGIRVQQGTGTLWRIRRSSGTAALRPDEPVVVPSYALKAAAGGLAMLVSWRMARRLRRRKGRK